MDLSTTAIVEGIKNKDENVFRQLYREYGGKITQYVVNNSGSREDGLEIAQITLMELWMAVTNGRYQEEGKLGQFIMQIAVNSWREELRKRKNRPSNSLDDSYMHPVAPDPEELAALLVKDRYLQAMHQALDAMAEPCQSIIRMYHLQSTRLQEVAVQLNYDYNNLRKRIFDCRNKLKLQVENLIRTNFKNNMES